MSPTINAAVLVLAVAMNCGEVRSAEPQSKKPSSAADEVKAGATPYFVRTAQSGPWSAPSTWATNAIPRSGDRVYIAAEHSVVYDVESDVVVRSLHLDGRLRFATDRSTLLEVGLIRVGADGSTDEQGADCIGMTHRPSGRSTKPRQAALLVGVAEQPIDGRFTATIRLHYIDGMDPQTCPAIVCCGARMEFHGSPLSRTWLKLGATAKVGAQTITLQEEVAGWKTGDRIILTATTRQNKIKKTFRPSTRDSTQTEERRIAAVDGRTITLDRPLEFEHYAEGDYRGDVANLSRNVIVESARHDGVRGHTMYQEGSVGSIGYAEFRHLGKPGVLGRYSLHFHLAGDSMRGTSVVGASIWDSGNRWITVHGTNYLVVRDCVGYQSRGHGFFLEDGTEVYNVFDRNLAVQAYIAEQLPNQVLPYDKNDGSGFWWANSRNTFTRNTAAECDEYGYFFQATKSDKFDPVLNVRGADGVARPTDIRTLPFVKFADNEAHCQRRHSFNLGGGAPFGAGSVGGIGPDIEHPFVIRGLKLWNVHWGIHPVSPSLALDGLVIHDAEYGIWRPEYKSHAYRNVRLENVPEKNYYAFTSENRPPNDEANFPKPLNPTDDQPPSTVITSIVRDANGRWQIRGTTSDDGEVASVTVNGMQAQSVRDTFSEWEVVLIEPAAKVVAEAVDTSGNRELTPHSRAWNPLSN